MIVLSRNVYWVTEYKFCLRNKRFKKKKKTFHFALFLESLTVILISKSKKDSQWELSKACSGGLEESTQRLGQATGKQSLIFKKGA